MNNDFEMAAASGFNNAGELLGLSESGMLSAFNNMDPLQRFQALRKMFSNTHLSRGSRADMEKHFRMLPKHVKEELLQGKLHLADWGITTVKHLDSKTVKLFESKDVKEVGITNISDAKLPKNSVIVVSGIRMMTGIAASLTDEEQMKATPYKSISTLPALVNGEFYLKAKRKQLIPEGFPNWFFETDNDNTLPLGYHRLDNPRAINDEDIIEAVVELATMSGVDPNQMIKIGLVGTITTP